MIKNIKNNYLLYYVIFSIIIVIGAFLIMINSNNDNSFIVTFDTDGGSEISSQKIQKGQFVTEPSPP